MVNYTRKKRGGKYVARGTYGCVFAPPLKCKNSSERMNNTHISKLMRIENAQEEFNESKLIWSNIDPDQNFSLTVIKLCDFDSSNLKASNEYEKCLEKNERDTLLIYKNGGLDLSKLKPHPKNYKPLFKELLNLMKGLEIAHSKNVIHGDIKMPNIVAAIKGSSMKLRFIDYGLSRDVTEVKEYEPVFADNTIYYVYWPFEFGCFDEKGKLLSFRDVSYRLYVHNNKLDDSSGKVSMGQINISAKDIYQFLLDTDFRYNYKEENNENIRNAYKRLDVYSMGVLLANLAYEYFSASFTQPADITKELYPFYYNVKSKKFVRYHQLKDKTKLSEKQIEFHTKLLEHIIKPLGILIGKMVNLNPNERISISEAIKEYEKLVPAFDTYLSSKDVAEGLENQYILNRSPDIPYVETPKELIEVQRNKFKPSRNLLKKNRSSKKKTNIFSP